MVILGLLASFGGISVAPPSRRLPLERGGALFLVRNETDPKFIIPGSQRRPLCVLARIDGEGYTLKKPGYVQGRKGPGAVFMKKGGGQSLTSLASSFLLQRVGLVDPSHNNCPHSTTTTTNPPPPSYCCSEWVWWIRHTTTAPIPPPPPPTPHRHHIVW